MDEAALSQTMLQSGKTIGTVHPLEVQKYVVQWLAGHQATVLSILHGG